VTLDAERVTRILVDELVRRHADEVDLVFRYGSLLQGSAHRYSDLDISWVPASADTWDAITVMVDDVLVDCYPIHWSVLERMSELQHVSCAILLHGRIVHRRSDAAAARFAALGERLRAVQLPAERPAMVRRALERFTAVGYPHYLLTRAARDAHVLAALQEAAAIRDIVLHCLALVNQAPVDTRRRAEVLALPVLPRGLAEALSQLDAAGDAAELLAAIDTLLDTTRALLVAEQATLVRETSFADAFRAAYPELKGDLQHVLLACERGAASPLELVSIQRELMAHLALALDGIEPSAFNALPDYERDLAALGFPDLLDPALGHDAATLHARVRAFDEHLRAFLVERGVDLCTFATPDDLKAGLAQAAMAAQER
jgi:hypothetical protein